MRVTSLLLLLVCLGFVHGQFTVLRINQCSLSGASPYFEFKVTLQNRDFTLDPPSVTTVVPYITCVDRDDNSIVSSGPVTPFDYFGTTLALYNLTSTSFDPTTIECSINSSAAGVPTSVSWGGTSFFSNLCTGTQSTPYPAGTVVEYPYNGTGVDFQLLTCTGGFATFAVANNRSEVFKGWVQVALNNILEFNSLTRSFFGSANGQPNSTFANPGVAQFAIDGARNPDPADLYSAYLYEGQSTAGVLSLVKTITFRCGTTPLPTTRTPITTAAPRLGLEFYSSCSSVTRFGLSWRTVTFDFRIREFFDTTLPLEIYASNPYLPTFTIPAGTWAPNVLYTRSVVATKVSQSVFQIAVSQPRKTKTVFTVTC